MSSPHEAAATWTRVCRLDSLVPDRGVAALVGGEQVAVFRLAEAAEGVASAVHAIGNHDPCSGANVLARGLVGSDRDRPFVASPMHKQRFDLVTGQCHDAEAAVPVYPVRVCEGWVEVAGRPRR